MNPNWDRFPCNNGLQLEAVNLYHKKHNCRPHKSPRFAFSDDNNSIKTDRVIQKSGSKQSYPKPKNMSIIQHLHHSKVEFSDSLEYTFKPRKLEVKTWTGNW